MKHLTKLLIIGLIFTGCKDDSTPIPAVNISDTEKHELLFLLEEEKLARDVYEYNYSKYDQSIFNNISSSEAKHMTDVASLLTSFNISYDYIDHNKRGEFINTELQALYDQLVGLSDTSYVMGLTVGAIEDLDIKDLADLKNVTTNSSILDVADKLQCGSRNHMRSFTSTLPDEGQTYKAQYIAEKELEEILKGNHESCGG